MGRERGGRVVAGVCSRGKAAVHALPSPLLRLGCAEQRVDTSPPTASISSKELGPTFLSLLAAPRVPIALDGGQPCLAEEFHSEASPEGRRALQSSSLAADGSPCAYTAS